MPYRRRTARTDKKKKQPRRRRRRVPRLRLGFPSTKLVKLRYCAPLNLDASAGSIGTHTYRMNSIHDPDYSGIGHECRFKDQWAQIYGRYCVLGAKVTVSILSPAAPVSAGQKIGIQMSGTDTGLTFPNTDITALLEAPMIRARMRTVHTNPSRTKPLSHYWSFKKTMGRLNPTDDVVSSTMTSSPSHAAYCVVFAGSAGVNDLENPPLLNCIVTIDYIVRLFEPKMNIPES